MHGDLTEGHLAEATKGAGAVREAVETLAATTAAAISGSVAPGSTTTVVAEVKESLMREL